MRSANTTINEADKSAFWTDPNPDGSAHVRGNRGYVSLPVGVFGSACPRCGSLSLTGALITETADENDPNIQCRDCGWWRD